jgi:hypothetical protein
MEMKQRTRALLAATETSIATKWLTKLDRRKKDRRGGVIEVYFVNTWANLGYFIN